MKRCENCFESNSDGATNCVICGDPLDVPQIDVPRADKVVLSSVVEVEEEIEVEVEVEPIYEDDEITQRDLLVLEELSADRIPVASPPSDAGPLDELTPPPEDLSVEPPLEPVVEPEPEPPPPPPEPVAASAPPPARPAPVVEGGQVVLQVFHDTEPRVVLTHPVVNDITLVGREDPQRDVFPDLDLGRLPKTEVSSGRASRQHLRLLRQGDRYFLYVYKGSTGTQVSNRMIDPSQYGKRFEIQVGDRIILGGKVRMKLTRVAG